MQAARQALEEAKDQQECERMVYAQLRNITAGASYEQGKQLIEWLNELMMLIATINALPEALQQPEENPLIKVQ